MLSVVIACAALLASCGGGNDSTSTAEPKMEVINGITVPPEPAPSINNATLAGVDMNANGVRDDVERIIAAKSTNKNDNQASQKIAAVYQAMLVSQPPKTRAAALEIYAKLHCAANGLSARTYGVGTNDMRDIIINTANRKAIFSAINTTLDGGFGGEELPACK